MMDLAKMLLKQYGILGLLVLGMSAFIWKLQSDATEERASHTALLIDQVSDLREKTERLEGVCRR